MKTLAQMIFAFLVVAILYSLSASNKNPDQKNNFDDSAKFKSRALITQQLKAPSTAKFCEEDIKKFQFAGADAWQITGCVDAQNSFGAMLRKNYTAVMMKSESGWSLVDLQFE